MTRYISFGVLIVTIIFLVILFYRVMAGFLIPLFLAALLVVIFRPVHAWILEKIKGRQKLAALLTTASILLVVLVPLGLLFALAAAEGRDLVRQLNAESILKKLVATRTSLGLDLPVAYRNIEIHFENMEQLSSPEDVDYHQIELRPIEIQTIALIEQLNPEIVEQDEPGPKDLEQLLAAKGDEPTAWRDYVASLAEVKKLQENFKYETDLAAKADELENYKLKLGETFGLFVAAKNNQLGGKYKALLIDAVNPSPETLKSYSDSFVEFFRSRLLALSASTGSFIGSLLLGVIIMILSLYFFLLDGPKMIDSIKGLSPLDDAHEEELVQEFGKVSRAVVVATLLSAFVQGLLGGIGYYFAGLESVFLLTLLTGCLALVPFVGAAAVWVPCSLYLYFFEGNTVAAIGLAIYGAAVISLADNLIKPLILHGQSNLHPLVALLSVLGGVSALGPIGILIGPMIVAFLQTLLRILQRELLRMDSETSTISLAK